MGKLLSKECVIPHELHPITSARGLEGELKALPMVSGAEPWKL